MSGGVPMGRSGPLIAMKMAEEAYDSGGRKRQRSLSHWMTWAVVVFDPEHTVELISVRRLDSRGSTRGYIYFTVVRSPLRCQEERMETAFYVAGIDVHKKMLAVAMANARDPELAFECRRFGTTACELRHLSPGLQERGVQEVVMESTAQYWKPVWIARLHWRDSAVSTWHRQDRIAGRAAARQIFEMRSGLSAGY
jgi:hypothetical protein